MDRDKLIELAPHYAAMLLLIYLVLGVVGILGVELGFWAELVVIVVIVFAYRPVVMRLGLGPSAWEQG